MDKLWINAILRVFIFVEYVLFLTISLQIYNIFMFITRAGLINIQVAIRNMLCRPQISARLVKMADIQYYNKYV